MENACTENRWRAATAERRTEAACLLILAMVGKLDGWSVQRKSVLSIGSLHPLIPRSKSRPGQGAIFHFAIRRRTMMVLAFLLVSLLSSILGAKAFVANTPFSSRGIIELKMSTPEIEVVSNPSKEFLDEKGGEYRFKCMMSSMRVLD